MQIYRVGGSVRDEILGYPSSENDWVVVGATKEELLAQGYQEVGRGFPVFLHPKTREEYALARTEKTTGKNYRDFICNTKNVSLEEDLSRRDLTINAIAVDANGKLIDPFNGKADLKNKILRHVSTAFTEDPVRVLRIARFAARYHHLGFRLAEETEQLIYKMGLNGAFKGLTPERVWKEWQKSLEEKNPEVFILVLRKTGALKYIIPELHKLFGIPQAPKHHPEIDTGIHTIDTIKNIVALTKDPVMRLALSLHDLGKAATPISKWPKHENHELAGVTIIKKLGKRLKIPNEYLDFAILMAGQHLKIHKIATLSAENILELLTTTDAFRRPERFIKLLAACEADTKNTGPRLLGEKILTAVSSIRLPSYENLKAKEIAAKIRNLRLEAINNCLLLGQ